MIIDSRFNGPPGSGNGGYTAGLIATYLAGGAFASGGGLPPPAQVTLRRPPPLATPLRVRAEPGRVLVYEGERLVADAVPAGAEATAPPPVPYDEAVTAAAAYPGFVDHPFPTCYVCGPRRPPGDGLRIFPGPLPGAAGRTAAPWQVPDDVSALTVWAALDCPGGWAIISAGRPYVLGRITAVVTALPAPGSRCVAVGEVVAAEGRKAEVRSALYAGADAPAATPLGYATATWIAI